MIKIYHLQIFVIYDNEILGKGKLSDEYIGFFMWAKKCEGI